jgi:hypothetical protein
MIDKIIKSSDGSLMKVREVLRLNFYCDLKRSKRMLVKNPI